MVMLRILSKAGNLYQQDTQVKSFKYPYQNPIGGVLEVTTLNGKTVRSTKIHQVIINQGLTVIDCNDLRYMFATS